MLKRFMTWLLHRLQKVLSIFSGRRSSPRPSVPSQQNPDRSPPVRPTDPLPLNNFALPNSAESASATDSEPEAPHPLNSTSVVQEVPLVSQNLPVETTEVALLLTSVDYASAEIQDASQLPEIHDLLPATEPDKPAELSANAELPPEKAELPLAAKEPAAADLSNPAELPAPPELPEPAELPKQAILFSFDIIESEVPSSEAIAQPHPETTVLAAASRHEIAYQVADTRESSSSSAFSAVESPPPLAAPPAEPSLPKGQMRPDQPATEPAAHEAKAPAQISIEIEETAEEILEDPITAADLAPAIEDPVTAADLAPAIEEPAEPSPAAEPLGKKGVVKLLFTAKPGNFHGYIAPDDGSKDILFHQKYINADIFEHLERGTPVIAAVKDVEGKTYATKVSLQETGESE